MGFTTATEGRFFIGDTEIGEMTDFTCTWDDTDCENSWIWNIPKSITLKSKIIWKNKIEGALGFTHYAKNGKLFRK